MIIAFCGPDGTGKSTYASLLSTMLGRNDHIVKRAWIKNVHLLSFFIISILETVNKRRVIRSTSGAIVTSSAANHYVLWVWIESFNIILKVLPYILLGCCCKLFKKKIFVVADRFIVDSLVHILISVMLLRPGLENKKEVLLKSLGSLPFRILRSLSIKYSTTILLDGKEEVLIKRKKKDQKCDPFWYLALQRALYRLVTSALAINVHYVNTTKKSIGEILYGDILKALEVIE